MESTLRQECSIVPRADRAAVAHDCQTLPSASLAASQTRVGRPYISAPSRRIVPAALKGPASTSKATAPPPAIDPPARATGGFDQPRCAEEDCCCAKPGPPRNVLPIRNDLSRGDIPQTCASVRSNSGSAADGPRRISRSLAVVFFQSSLNFPGGRGLLRLNALCGETCRFLDAARAACVRRRPRRGGRPAPAKRVRHPVIDAAPQARSIALSKHGEKPGEEACCSVRDGVLGLFSREGAPSSCTASASILESSRRSSAPRRQASLR